MPIIKSPEVSLQPPLPRAIMLLGTWNAGKSFLSASASKKYPALPWVPFSPSNPKPLDFPLVQLDDMFYHCWEPDCFAGFPDGGLAIPPHWDLAGTTGGELDDAVDQVLAETTSRVKAGKTSVVVVDTLSAFNSKNHARSMFGVTQAKNDDDDTKTTETNLQKVWGSVLSRHIKYLNGLLSCAPPLIIFNVHPKVNDPAFRGTKSDSAGKALNAANQKAKGLGDQATIIAEITGQAYGQYLRNCSLVMYVDSKVASVPDGKGGFRKVTERWINPHKKDDVMARSKYACLSDKEPADLRVIFDKIKGVVQNG